MIRGFFRENLPFVRVPIMWGQIVITLSFIVDTGFSGDLQITYETAKEMHLEIFGDAATEVADGSVIVMPTSAAIATMEEEQNYVRVLISNGDPLIGIGFLSKFEYKATIDAKYQDVVLEKSI